MKTLFVLLGSAVLTATNAVQLTNAWTANDPAEKVHVLEPTYWQAVDDNSWPNKRTTFYDKKHGGVWRTSDELTQLNDSGSGEAGPTAPAAAENNDYGQIQLIDSGNGEAGPSAPAAAENNDYGQ